MIRIFASTTLTLLILCNPLTAVDTSQIQARVYFVTKDAWAQLRDLHLDQVWKGPDYIEIVTDRVELDMIESLGYKTDIIHADLGEFLRSRLPDKAMGAYKTLDEIYQYLDLLMASYPAIMTQRTSIGQTYEGRDMWAVKISDNPEIDEDEPEILYTAAIHAREVITPEVLFHFMDHLTQNYGVDPQVTDLVDNRELWFILVANPDGYYYNEVTDPDGGGMWRKNRRDNGDGSFGVDLNRNFGYEWGYDDAGSSPYPDDNTYRGTAPFSEPETQNLRDFTEDREFVISVYYHSYSNLILWPWAYDRIYAPDDDIFSAIGDSVSPMNEYAPGPGWTLYPVNGGSDDWNYGEQTTKDKIFALTLEVGSYTDNFWPPASRIEDLVSENLEPNLFFAAIADRIYRLRAPDAPIAFVDTAAVPGGYAIGWTHDDTLNPAAVFELTEMSDYQVIADPADGFDAWDTMGFHLSPDRFFSSPTSFYSGDGDNLVSRVRSRDPYLVGTGDSLKFQTYYAIENSWDYAYVEISTDGAQFDPIPGTITHEDNPHGTNRGNGITGTSGGWIEAAFDLSDFAGQYVYIQFSYYTDEYVTVEGFYVDDIVPVAIFGVHDTIFPITDSSYVFSYQPPGEYFYEVRARDDEQQWSPYSNVVRIAFELSFHCGDADGDDAVNVSDAVFTIDYIFKGGQAPDPLESGDANGDGSISVADAVYVIAFIFKGGPEPVCP